MSLAVLHGPAPLHAHAFHAGRCLPECLEDLHGHQRRPPQQHRQPIARPPRHAV